MTNAEQAIAILDAAREMEQRPEDAMALLADAIAIGLNEGDFDPEGICSRIRESFETLHIAKYAPHLARSQ